MAIRKLSEYLECGEIVNTHGIKGEVKISPWCDSPAFLSRFRRFFVDGREIKVVSTRVQGQMLFARLDGIDDINAAMTLKGKKLFIARDDAKLEDGAYFLSDIIGAEVRDEEIGVVGMLEDFLELPAGRVFVVRGETEHLIPDVPEFVRKVDVEAGVVTVKLIEGM
ncbi:MAG: 16S rRNA processing protein RimM [Oscillospiraceae bacterium]|nr:16S rRNA processing protein RimM [Oscillospiraceae bacterium]